ncbi:MAG: flavodoxin family protein [Bulleidia sp.]|nr:flavodoxin family protein [Bulleidia sp.]
MAKNVVIISASNRVSSNSDALAGAFAKGAEESGDNVTYISLRGKKIAFCLGCLACQKTGTCVIKDDAVEIEKQVVNADVVVWATPIYYYEMPGQMKTLIDRLNPMYPKDCRFRDIYFLTSAAEEDPETPKRAIAGLQGWIDCFEKAELKGTVFCGGVNDPGEIAGNAKLSEAYEMGRNVK